MDKVSLKKSGSFATLCEDYQINTMEDKKFFLTEEGVAVLRKELKELNVLRKEKVNEDSESCDDLAMIDKKIGDIALVLKSCELITVPPKDKRDTVNLGASVTVQSSDGQTNNFVIVGTVEANPPLGKISNESPVGRALLGKKVGDTILIHMNSKAYYTVKKIAYDGLGKTRKV